MLRSENTRAKKVLIFNHSYPVQFIDVSNQYARVYREAGARVTVVYLTGKADEEVRRKTLGEEVIFLDCSPSVTRGLKLSVIRRMIQLQRDEQFDLVVCHRYKPTYIMLWVARFCHIPLLISVMHELGCFRSWARKALLAGLATKNCILAGVSNAVRNDLRRSVWGLPPSRIITLYNVIDVDLTEPCYYPPSEARRRLGLPPTAFIFGNVGRLAKNKDQRTLIMAFSQMKASAPQAKLIIIGAGQLEDELKQLVKCLELESEVLFTGFLPEAFRYMKAFDVFVSSSMQEAFGRVLLEAMLARVPTIATRVNGMPEVLGETGLLVPPSNPEQLATAMNKLYQLSSQQQTDWGSRGYYRVLQEFSLKRFTETLACLPKN